MDDKGYCTLSDPLVTLLRCASVRVVQREDGVRYYINAENIN